MTYLFVGLIVGFFVAIPVGAAAVLCINRSIQYGYKAGFFTGFGVAIADLVYGIFAVFGLFAISNETLQNQPVLRLIGAFCIMFVGLRMISKFKDPIKKEIDHETIIKDILTGFMVTISNPMTLIAFIAVLSYVNYLLVEINFLGLFMLEKQLQHFNTSNIMKRRSLSTSIVFDVKISWSIDQEFNNLH